MAVAPITGTTSTTPDTSLTPAPAPKYTFQQLENLWTSNGGSPQWAATMAAVALYGESGGDATIVNKSSGATGLWQVLSSAQTPAFNAQHPSANMKDPNANARAAIALLGNGSGLQQGWGTDQVAQYVAANGGTPLSQAAAQNFQTTSGEGATAKPN